MRRPGGPGLAMSPRNQSRTRVDRGRRPVGPCVVARRTGRRRLPRLSRPRPRGWGACALRPRRRGTGRPCRRYRRTTPWARASWVSGARPRTGSRAGDGGFVDRLRPDAIGDGPRGAPAPGAQVGDDARRPHSRLRRTRALVRSHRVGSPRGETSGRAAHALGVGTVRVRPRLAVEHEEDDQHDRRRSAGPARSAATSRAPGVVQASRTDRERRNQDREPEDAAEDADAVLGAVHADACGRRC